MSVTVCVIQRYFVSLASEMKTNTQYNMKGSIKSLYMLCLTMVTALCLSCNQKSKLEQFVDETSKQCPIDLGELGKMSSIVIEENGDVTIELCLNEDYISEDLLEANDSSKYIYLDGVTYQPEYVQNLLKEIVNEKVNFVYRYVGDRSKKKVEYKITWQELEKAFNSKPVLTANDEKQLREQVDGMNKTCPIKPREEYTLDSVTLDKGFLTYHFTLEVNSNTLSKLEESVIETKAELAENLRQNLSGMESLFTTCIMTNRTIRYHYRISNSYKTFDLDFTPENLKEIMK